MSHTFVYVGEYNMPKPIWRGAGMHYSHWDEVKIADREKKQTRE